MATNQGAGAREVTWAPLAPRATSVAVCEARLRQTIVGGQLPPGSPLPAERSLAAQLGVNRTTLRAAIGKLVSAGLLTAEQGRGTFVRDFRAEASIDVVRDLDAAQLTAALGEGASPASLARDLLHVRRCLSRAVLEALVESPPGPEKIADVERAVAAFRETLVSNDLERRVRADLDALAAVVNATGRVGLRLCINPVARTLAALPWLREAIHADPETHGAAYEVLLAFVRAPNADGVEPLLRLLEARDELAVSRLGPATTKPEPARRRGGR